MGEPEEIAREFNDNFSDKELKAGKQKSYYCIAGVVVIVVLLVAVTAVFLLPKEPESKKQEADSVIPTSQPVSEESESSKNSEAVKSHSDYVEDEVIEKTKLIISLLDEADYDMIKNQYTAEILKETMDKSQIEPAKKTINPQWGSRVSFGKFYMEGVEQGEEKYVVVQVNVAYEQVSVTYTITFDEEMKLAGLYMK